MNQLSLWQQGTPMLDERPPTPEELAWWRTASRPYRRRMRWLGYSVMLGVSATQFARDPAGFFGWELLILLPLMGGVGAATNWMNWRMTERTHLQTALAGKRIRERLLADAAAERAA